MASVGAFLVLYATAWGPWAYSDGVGYMVSARNLLHGAGLGLHRPSGEFIPTVSHPPLFPLTLAAAGKFTPGILQATRLVQAGMFFAFVFLVPALFERLIRSSALAVALAFLLVLHPSVLLMHFSSMSEPMFILIGTLSLLTLALWLTGRSHAFLAVSASLAALAVLTRYVGIAHALTGAIIIGLFGPRLGMRRRAIAAIAYLSLAMVPTLGFFALASNTGGAFRVLQWPSSPIELSLQFLGQAAGVVWHWKPLPTRAVIDLILTRFELRAIFLIAVICLSALAVAIARWLRTETRRVRQISTSADRLALFRVLVSFWFSFLAVMFFGYIFTAPTPDIDFRTLFPLLPPLLLAGFTGVAAVLARGVWHDTNPLIPAVFLSVLIVGYSPTSLDLIAGLHRTGLGFTAREWHESPTLQAVQKLRPGTTLVSNAPEAILLYSDRSSYLLPTVRELDSARPSDRTPRQAPETESLLCNPDTYLILFDASLDGAESVPDPMVETQVTCDLELIFEGADGAIYEHQPASP